MGSMLPYIAYMDPMGFVMVKIIRQKLEICFNCWNTSFEVEMESA